MPESFFDKVADLQDPLAVNYFRKKYHGCLTAFLYTLLKITVNYSAKTEKNIPQLYH